MNRWKRAAPLVACLASAFAVGCATHEVAVAAPVPEVVANSAPPPLQVEVVPVAPSVDHAWVRGHWHWNGAAWIWRAGHYEVRRGFAWVAPTYVERGGSTVYVEGHWVAR
jgi:WXXGXW repeat (2 copies)